MCLCLVKGRPQGVPGAPNYHVDLGLPFESWQLDPAPLAPGSRDWGLSFQFGDSGDDDER